MVPGVRVDTTTNGWACATIDMAVIRTFLFTDVVMAVTGRRQSG